MSLREMDKQSESGSGGRFRGRVEGYSVNRLSRSASTNGSELKSKNSSLSRNANPSYSSSISTVTHATGSTKNIIDDFPTPVNALEIKISQTEPNRRADQKQLHDADLHANNSVDGSQYTASTSLHITRHSADDIGGPGGASNLGGIQQIGSNNLFLNENSDELNIDSGRKFLEPAAGINTMQMRQSEVESNKMDITIPLPSESFHGSAFNVGDCVTVDRFRNKVFGQVKWIGQLPGENVYNAAIELSDQTPNYVLEYCNTGIIYGKWILCDSSMPNILVTRVKDCERVIYSAEHSMAEGYSEGRAAKELLAPHQRQTITSLITPTSGSDRKFSSDDRAAAADDECYPRTFPENCPFEIDSIVILPNHNNATGVVRWIGLFGNDHDTWLAIEVDDSFLRPLHHLCTNGTVYGKKLCRSSTENILLTALRDVELYNPMDDLQAVRAEDKISHDFRITHEDGMQTPTTAEKVSNHGAAADNFYPPSLPENSVVEIDTIVSLPHHHAEGVVRWIGIFDDLPDTYRVAVELEAPIAPTLQVWCTDGWYQNVKLCATTGKNIFVTELSDVVPYDPIEQFVGDQKVHVPVKSNPADRHHPMLFPSTTPCYISDRVYLPKCDNVKGTVRWIGKLPTNKTTYYAAIELDEPIPRTKKKRCTFGKFGGVNLCSSTKQNIFVELLEHCVYFSDGLSETKAASFDVGDLVCVRKYGNAVGNIKWIGYLRREPTIRRVALKIVELENFEFRYNCTYGDWEGQKLCNSFNRDIFVTRLVNCQLLDKKKSARKPTLKAETPVRGTVNEEVLESTTPEGLAFNIGDMVTTTLYPEEVGSVRWIGFIPRLGTYAAVELLDGTYAERDCCYGSFQGYRLCQSDKQNILVERVENCHPLVARQQHPKEEEKPDVVRGDIKPILSETKVLGIRKGIQGEHNSCYMDASLFSMFAFNSFFDAWMLSGGVNKKNSEKRELYQDIQRTLQTMIVNPLRRNGYVKSVAVQNLRKHLDAIGLVDGLKTEEKDPEELLNLLLNDVFDVKPFMKLSNEQEMHTFHLMADRDSKFPFPNIRKLLEFTFNQEKLTLAQIPDCMILHLPRFGKEMKLYENVFPNEELDISDLLQAARKCYLCGEKAAKECEECFKEGKNPQIQGGTFCKDCDVKMHKRADRARHHRRRIENTSGVEMGMSSRVKLILSAVLCIERSHYVAYVRTKINGPFKWVFFDSMSDREGDQNIPKVEVIPDLNLSEESYRKLKQYGVSSLSPLPKRLFKDAYICIYINPETGQFQ